MSESEAPKPDPRFDPAFQHGFAGDAADARGNDRNPFIRALWVACAVMSFAAGYLIVWSQFRSLDSGYSGAVGGIPFELLLMQLAWVIGPPALTAGLGGMVGLLFWHAAEWRARHRRLDPRAGQ